MTLYFICMLQKQVKEKLWKDFIMSTLNRYKTYFIQRSSKVSINSGADPGFQVRGAALKKIAPSGGRREIVWGISCEKSRFYAKKIIFFPILGGRSPGRKYTKLNLPITFARPSTVLPVVGEITRIKRHKTFNFKIKSGMCKRSLRCKTLINFFNIFYHFFFRVYSTILSDV